MSDLYRRILLPSDGSGNVLRALPHAISLAQDHQAELVLLAVYELTDALTAAVARIDSGLQKHLDAAETHLKDHAHHQLDELAKQLKERGLSFHQRVVKGRPGPTICEVAAEEECDLIVMGSRGLSAVKEALIGSTSQYVLHHSHCPCLMVH